MATETKHGHEHHAGPTGYASVPWSVAASATLHCLTGCAIGEVLGMVIGTALGLRQRRDGGPVDRAGVRVRLWADDARGAARGCRVRRALKIALAADTVSIAVMEIVDNAIVLSVPGAMEAGLASWLFWARWPSPSLWRSWSRCR